MVLDSDGERGAQQAADAINAAGGIDGRRLELRVIHGLSTVTEQSSRTAADSLAADPEIVAVVGHTNSSASLAAAQVYNERHIVELAPTTTAALYREAGPYSFRMVAGDEHQGEFLGRLVAADSMHARTAVMYVNDDYGRALHASFVQALTASGFAPAYDAPYNDGARFTDVDEVAAALARSHPGLLVWLGRSPELRAVLPKLRELAPGVRVLASDGFSRQQFSEDPARSMIGVRYVRFVDLGSADTLVQSLRRGFEARYHYEFSDQYPLAYDAVRLLAAAVAANGNDREGVRRYLAGLNAGHGGFAGLAGPITFDEHGDPPPSYHLVEVTPQGSKPVEEPVMVARP